MPHLPALTVSRVAYYRSRQLMCDSQALIAYARELIRPSRFAIGQQTSLTIVCAWCQSLGGLTAMPNTKGSPLSVTLLLVQRDPFVREGLKEANSSACAHFRINVSLFS